MSSSAERRRGGVARSLALLLVAALAAPAARAQDAAGPRAIAPDDLGGVIVSVVAPADKDGLLDASAQHLLEARMGASLAGAGVAGVSSVTPFLMYAIAALVDEQQVDAGLEPRTVVALEVTFVVRHVASRSIIHQWTRRLVGTSSTRPAAIRQAIASLSPSDAGLHDFGVETRRRIVDFYAKSCDAVRAGARAAAATGHRAQALAELAAVPSDAAACQQAALRDVASITHPAAASGATRPPNAAPPRAGAPLPLETRLQAVGYMDSADAKANMVRLAYSRP